MAFLWYWQINVSSNILVTSPRGGNIKIEIYISLNRSGLRQVTWWVLLLATITEGEMTVTWPLIGQCVMMLDSDWAKIL